MGMTVVSTRSGKAGTSHGRILPLVAATHMDDHPAVSPSVTSRSPVWLNRSNIEAITRVATIGPLTLRPDDNIAV